jgi:hypothetical protein
MDEEMYSDKNSELVEEAHAVFNATAVFEMVDMNDRQSAEDFLYKIKQQSIW